MRLISAVHAGADALSMGAALAHHLGAALPPGMLALVRSTWATLSHRATRCGRPGAGHRLDLVRHITAATRSLPLILALAITGCATAPTATTPTTPPAWCSTAAASDTLILRQSPTTPGETAARSGWLILPGLTPPDPWALIGIARGRATIALPAETLHAAPPAAASPRRGPAR